MHMPLHAPHCASRADCLIQANLLILDRIRPLQTAILDLGCGEGAFAVEAARRYGVPTLGVALTKREINLARDRARRVNVSGLCTFQVRDMNRLHDLEDGIFSTVVTLETDCYLKPYREGVCQIHRITTQNGLWHNIRFCLTDSEAISSSTLRDSAYIQRAWQTTPLQTPEHFKLMIRDRFIIEEELDLTNRVVAFWSDFIDLQLSARTRVFARFLRSSFLESRRLRELPIVFRHRLAFWKYIRGLATGVFSHRYYRLRRR